MDKKIKQTGTLTSIEIDDYFPKELAQDIVNYIKKKKIKKVKMKIGEELKKRIEKNYPKEEFNILVEDIEDILLDDGRWFFLEIPEIKTSWEKFADGISADSYQKDFKKFFSKYEEEF